MSEYKRLTERDKNGFVEFEECEKCDYCGSAGCDSFENAINLLAELEDKIENGTLAALGYPIRKSYKNHDDQRYKIILIDEVEIDKIGYDGLTKEKAEARLKELQEEQK